jgi:hypothetical protein
MEELRAAAPRRRPRQQRHEPSSSNQRVVGSFFLPWAVARRARPRSDQRPFPSVSPTAVCGVDNPSIAHLRSRILVTKKATLSPRVRVRRRPPAAHLERDSVPACLVVRIADAAQRSIAALISATVVRARPGDGAHAAALMRWRDDAFVIVHAWQSTTKRCTATCAPKNCPWARQFAHIHALWQRDLHVCKEGAP